MSFQSFATPSLNNAGQSAFFAYLSGANVTIDNEQSIWSEGGGMLHLVAREGDAAPGTLGDAVYRGLFSTETPTLNRGGQTVFKGSLAGTEVTSNNNVGIWFEGLNGTQLAAREGDPVPGAGLGVVWGSFGFGNPSVNDAGEIAFLGSLTGEGVTSANDYGIWSGPVGNLQVRAREGDAAPGMASGATYSSLLWPPLLNAIPYAASNETSSNR